MTDGAGPRLLVVTWNVPGPSETFIVDHLTGMVDRGWGVTLCCVEDVPERPVELDRLDDVLVLGPPSSATRAWRVGRERTGLGTRSAVARHAAVLAAPLRAVLTERQPDLVHAHYGPNAAGVTLALGDDPTPRIADLHGYDLTEIPHKEGWAAYRQLLAGATLVVHSEYAATQVREGMEVEAEQIPLVAPTAFQPPVRPESWAPPLHLLFVGRLVAMKGVDVALEALQLLVERRPDLDARLTIIGSGPDDDVLRTAVHRLGLDDRVQVRGAATQTEVAAAMSEHTVLLVPSRPTPTGWVEAFGLAAAEGVASGMGVVASRSGGLPEAIGPNGVLVEPGDPSALVDGVLELLASTTPAGLAEAARRLPTDGHRTADAYDRLSRSLLD